MGFETRRRECKKESNGVQCVGAGGDVGGQEEERACYGYSKECERFYEESYCFCSLIYSYHFTELLRIYEERTAIYRVITLGSNSSVFSGFLQQHSC